MGIQIVQSNPLLVGDACCCWLDSHCSYMSRSITVVQTRWCIQWTFL